MNSVCSTNSPMAGGSLISMTLITSRKTSLPESVMMIHAVESLVYKSLMVKFVTVVITYKRASVSDILGSQGVILIVFFICLFFY